MGRMVLDYFEKDAEQFVEINGGSRGKFNQNYSFIARHSMSVLSMFAALIEAKISCLWPLIEQQIVRIALLVFSSRHCEA